MFTSSCKEKVQYRLECSSIWENVEWSEPILLILCTRNGSENLGRYLDVDICLCSGTSLIWTPLGWQKVSWSVKRPDFRGLYIHWGPCSPIYSSHSMIFLLQLVEKKCQYWLLLFRPTEEQKNLFVRATWDGVAHIVHSMYPNVYPDLIHHLPILKNTPFAEFEKEAGFSFLECRRNICGDFPDKPPYYSYDFYCTLPKPRTALQVRLFLYCEIRLLEMFRGDGYSSSAKPDSVHCLEYLCPNLQLSEFGKEHLAVLPMTHICIPD